MAEFISGAPARTAKLAVVRADGSPHVAPLWVDLDDEEIVFMTTADTLKGKAIFRVPVSASVGTTKYRSTGEVAAMNKGE